MGINNNTLKLNIMKALKLIHKTSQKEFIYIGEFKPQFSNDIFVRLLNISTGKEERFLKNTYLNFFHK